MRGWVPEGGRSGTWRAIVTAILVVCVVAAVPVLLARDAGAPPEARPDGVGIEAAATPVLAEELLAEEPQVLASLPEEEVRALAAEGVVVTPAPSSAATEAISASEALQVALEEFGLPKGMDAWEAAKPGTTLALCRYTDLDMGTELPDGTVDPRYEDVLVWLVTIPEVEFPIFGPGPPKGPDDVSPRVPHAYMADMVVVVDAVKGRFIVAMSVNPGPPFEVLG